MAEAQLIEALNVEAADPVAPVRTEQAAAKAITAKITPRTNRIDRAERAAERAEQAAADKAQPRLSRSDRIAVESEGMDPAEVAADAARVDRLDAVRSSNRDALKSQSQDLSDEDLDDLKADGDQYDRDALGIKDKADADDPAKDADAQDGIDPLFRDPAAADAANPYNLGDETEFTATNGKQYKLPRDLVEGNLRQADYTRSKQEVAELKRNTVAERQMLAISAKVNEELAPAIAHVHNLRQLNTADRQKYPDIRVDPVGYLELDKLIRDREVLATELEQAVAAKRTEYSTQQQSVQSELLHSGIEYLRRVTKGNWNVQIQQQVGQYAVSQGYAPEELTANFDPRFVLMSYKAMQYERSLARQQQAKKPLPVEKRRDAAPAPMIKQRAPVPTERSSRENPLTELRTRVSRTGTVNDAGDAIAAMLARSAQRRR